MRGAKNNAQAFMLSLCTASHSKFIIRFARINCRTAMQLSGDEYPIVARIQSTRFQSERPARVMQRSAT